MHTLSVLLAEGVWLTNPVKSLLMAVPFIPWAWITSTKLEKDATYFHLNVAAWNWAYLLSGVVALAAMLFVPIFWIGLPVGMLILAAPILLYWKVRNSEVPASQKYTLGSGGMSAKREERKAAKLAKDAVYTFIGAKGSALSVPPKEDPAYLVHVAAEDFIGPAIDARASSVEMQIGKQGAVVAQTVDGVRYKREPLDTQTAVAIVDYFKKMAGLDVEDRRRRQRGASKARGPAGQRELTVLTAGRRDELTLRIEFDREDQLTVPYDQLGMLPAQRESLASTIIEEDRHGIILLSAPAGQGLRTSVYAFLDRHDAFTSNIKSLEREVEREIAGIDHVQWDPDSDADYSIQLQSILRRDPDIVQTGFMLDRESAAVATGPGMDGPLIYVPMRSKSIVEALQQWFKLVGDPKTASKSLRSVVNQRLMRKLCPQCKAAYTPNEAQLKKLNLNGKVTQLYDASGKVQVKNKIENCPVCAGTGYLGQTAVFEVLTLDRDMRKMLAKGDLKGVLNTARRNKMILLQEAALKKAVDGETSLKEVVRVTAQPAAKPAAKKPAAAPA